MRPTSRRKPGEIHWAVYRRNLDGSESRYYLSNAPQDAPLETLAYVGGSRWRIETEFETEKSDVGLDEYETRTWAGWHHHMALCLLVLGLALGSVWLLPPSLASAQEPPGLSLISISAAQTSVAEGQDATFTLTRTGNTSTELTVRVYSIEFFHPDGSGSLDNPTGQYHQVTFDSGSDTATLTVTTDFDGVPESSDSLDAVISPEEGSPYRNGDPSQASVAITDVARVVTIAADQTTVTEGDTVTFTLTRTGPTTKAVVVNVSVSDPGSFLRGNHWQPNPVLPTEAIFEVESSTTTISLQTKDDLRDIPDNNLTVTVNSGIGYSTASDADSASIAVTDNDVAPTLHLSIDSDSVEEGETLTITLQITGGSRWSEDTKESAAWRVGDSLIDDSKRLVLREADKVVLYVGCISNSPTILVKS